MSVENKKIISSPKGLSRKPLVKLKSATPAEQAAIYKNISQWAEDDASRLALKKAIDSLNARSKKLIKQLRRAEYTDPKEPIVRASASKADPETNELEDFKEYYAEDSSSKSDK